VSLVSSTAAYATPGALTAPATTNFFVAAIILGLFVLSAALSAEWYPRYCLPLAAIVPLAGLSLLAAVKAPCGAPLG
jgi:hypothetical protein